MIHSLLGVCLICMGVGAKASTPINSYRHTEEKQERQLMEENEPENTPLTFNATLNLQNPNGVWANTLDDTQNWHPPYGNYAPPQMVIAQTTIPYTNINTMQIRGSIRDENLVIQNDRSGDYCVALPYTNNPSHETSSLWSIQLDPSNYIVDTNSTITLKINGKIHNEVANDNYTIRVKTWIIYSTLETWQQYINTGINFTYRYNWQTYSTLTNGSLGTNYQTETEENYFEMSGTNLEESYDISKNIHIDSSKTNFVFIYQEVTADPLTNNDAYCLYQLPDNHTSDTIQYINFFNGDNELRRLTISGTYIVPPTSYEVVDIPGLMWQILSMPFAFISTAFNLTLFPGTPYQVNVSNLILMVFGVLVFIFIFKLILKK